ncbi:hypothetical protein J7K41_02655 [Candidatus Micrarchaeota archaeon]|nr:hypothetical protein [Candidatus Micrarchaeota archaeon]
MRSTVRRSVLALVFLLFVVSEIAYADYVEKVRVFVGDVRGRAVPGADLWTVYKINQIRGFVKTRIFETDESGLADIEFWYTEKDERKADYDYTLYVTYPGDDYDGPQSSASIRLNAKKTVNGVTQFVKLKDVYFVRLHVYNADTGDPIHCNVTFFDEVTEETDVNGDLYLEMPKGTHPVYIDVGGLKKMYYINVTEDGQVINLPVGIYTFTVNVVDDFGNPINATLSVFNISYNLSGSITLSFIAENPVFDLTVTHGASLKNVSVNVLEKDNVTVSFDRSEPDIEVGDIIEDVTGVFINVRITDPGRYPSGISQSKPPKLYYSVTVDNRTSRGAVTMIRQGDYYRARVPEILDGGVLEYEIDAYDNAGNLAVYMGTYTGKGTTENLISNETQPSNQSGSTGPEQPSSGQSFNMITTVSMAVGVIVFILILYYVKKRFFG